MRDSSVATYDGSSQLETSIPPSRWACALLGIVLIAAGMLALGDVAFATIISVKLIGLTAIAAGAFEIIHAFWTRGWDGFLWQILLGALYLARDRLADLRPSIRAESRIMRRGVKNERSHPA